MHRSLVALLGCFAVLLAVGLNANADDKKDKKDDKKPKYSIEDVMKKGMKGGLCKKVASGKAKKEEIATLAAMFADMAKQKPHKGDAKSWKTKCDALIAAVKEVQDGKKGAGAKLGKAANCKACHTVHKKK